MEQGAAPAGRSRKPALGRLRDPRSGGITTALQGACWTRRAQMPGPRKPGPELSQRRKPLARAAVERRKASALRQGRAAARRKLVRLSALRSPRVARGNQKAGEPGAFQAIRAAERWLSCCCLTIKDDRDGSENLRRVACARRN